MASDCFALVSFKKINSINRELKIICYLDFYLPRDFYIKIKTFLNEFSASAACLAAKTVKIIRLVEFMLKFTISKTKSSIEIWNMFKMKINNQAHFNISIPKSYYLFSNLIHFRYWIAVKLEIHIHAFFEHFKFSSFWFNSFFITTYIIKKIASLFNLPFECW